MEIISAYASQFYCCEKKKNVVSSSCLGIARDAIVRRERSGM